MGFFRLTLPVVPTVLHTQDMRLKTYYTIYKKSGFEQDTGSQGYLDTNVMSIRFQTIYIIYNGHGKIMLLQYYYVNIFLLYEYRKLFLIDSGLMKKSGFLIISR